MIVADVAEFARLLNVDNRDGPRQTCSKFQRLILSSRMVDIMIHMCVIMMWIFKDGAILSEGLFPWTFNPQGVTNRATRMQSPGFKLVKL